MIARKHIPTWITLSRVILLVPILYMMGQESTSLRIAAAVLFIVASLTDTFDGYYARKWQVVSPLGQFLDPMADKILVTSVLVALIPTGKIDTWMVILLLARDTFVSSLRSVAASENLIIAANPTGKWKTALQMIAIPAVIIDQKIIGLPIEKIGHVVLWFSVILSVTSAIEYGLAYLKAQRGRTVQ